MTWTLSLAKKKEEEEKWKKNWSLIKSKGDEANELDPLKWTGQALEI